MNFMTVHSIGNVIIPTDELIFFRGVWYTTNQLYTEGLVMNPCGFIWHLSGWMTTTCSVSFDGTCGRNSYVIPKKDGKQLKLTTFEDWIFHVLSG